jgi:hypothetical protein
VTVLEQEHTGCKRGLDCSNTRQVRDNQHLSSRGRRRVANWDGFGAVADCGARSLSDYCSFLPHSLPCLIVISSRPQEHHNSAQGNCRAVPGSHFPR